MTVASLAMYSFTATRPAYEHLWDAVRARLPFDAPGLDWHASPEAVCRRADLLIGQTCGWPLITTLRSEVRVVGTFDCLVDGGSDGTYCSVLVTGLDGSLADIFERPALTVAASNPDSLSGWISLQVIAHTNGVRLDDVEWTGSHAASVDAVIAGRAGLASIDAVSWTHLATSELRVVGHGPRVPCLPLVTARSSTDSVIDELRGALRGAVHDPSMAATCASLRIRGFLDRELADYQPLAALAATRVT